MSELSTYAIEMCTESSAYGDEAKTELQALLDENYRKEAQIVELERRITDIHRHYAKRLGD